MRRIGESLKCHKKTLGVGICSMNRVGFKKMLYQSVIAGEIEEKKEVHDDGQL